MSWISKTWHDVIDVTQVVILGTVIVTILACILEPRCLLLLAVEWPVARVVMAMLNRIKPEEGWDPK